MLHLLVYYGQDSDLKKFKEENKDVLQTMRIVTAQNRDVEGIRIDVLPWRPE